MAGKAAACFLLFHCVESCQSELVGSPCLRKKKQLAKVTVNSDLRVHAFVASIRRVPGRVHRHPHSFLERYLHDGSLCFGNRD